MSALRDKPSVDIVSNHAYAVLGVVFAPDGRPTVVLYDPYGKSISVDWETFQANFTVITIGYP